MMQRLLLSLSLTFILTAALHGQGLEVSAPEDNKVAAEQLSLLTELQALEAKAGKLEGQLAQARAKAEIADATWGLDQTRAQKLLREAYELTFPEEAERLKLRNRPVGADPPMPTAIERARDEIRKRILNIALRDKTFAAGLVQSGAEQLGKYEAHFRYAVLASQAFAAGDKEAVSQYSRQSIAAEPTQGTIIFTLLEVAERDRTLADKLIIQHIEQLRAFQSANANYNLPRSFFFLTLLIFPSTNPNLQQPPPSPAVMHTYVSYVIDTLAMREQFAPGSLQRARGYLLLVWPLLQQYAPELAATFFELEKRSRRPGEDASLPSRQSQEEAAQDTYDKRLKDALKSEHPDEMIIYAAVSHGDFAKARKLIEKLPDGAQKTQLTDMVNAREALSLVAKDDLPGAQRLAEQLTKATSMLQVYPVLVGKCGVRQDEACANALVYQAIKQLKRADAAPPTPPAGIPAAAIASARELDPVLSSLCKLAQAVLPINESLAFEVLDEAVQAANRSEMDTGQGRTGFDADVFKQFAAKNDARVRQAAETLKDPLRQIVARAAIYQREAEVLSQPAAGQTLTKRAH